MKKIFAVVLTYNRKDLLKRCLEAVYSQTRTCDAVIVVDNAGTDGTEQMLRLLEFPNLEVHVLSKNIGASGGFNAGFRIAYEKGADFVWMMDDDVIPSPDALQRLEEADQLLEQQSLERSFLLSTAYTEGGLITNAPSIDQRRNRIDYENWPLTLEHGIVPVRRATFVSILVPRATLAKYGLPLASMFIWGEDTEYTLRVTRDAPGYIIGNSKVLHLRQENGAISILAEHNPNRLKYHRHYVRNEVFVARKYFRPRRLILSIVHQFKLISQLLAMKEFEKAGIVFKGLTESLHFSPEVEAVDAPITNLGVSVRSFRLGVPQPLATPAVVVSRLDPVNDDKISEQFLRAAYD